MILLTSIILESWQCIFVKNVINLREIELKLYKYLSLWCTSQKFDDFKPIIKAKSSYISF
jgi:hypothetical protein